MWGVRPRLYESPPHRPDISWPKENIYTVFLDFMHLEMKKPLDYGPTVARSLARLKPQPSFIKYKITLYGCLILQWREKDRTLVNAKAQACILEKQNHSELLNKKVGFPKCCDDVSGKWCPFASQGQSQTYTGSSSMATTGSKVHIIPDCNLAHHASCIEQKGDKALVCIRGQSWAWAVGPCKHISAIKLNHNCTWNFLFTIPQ